MEIKSDVKWSLSEFHRNGKLVIGLNCMFIVLIPKVENVQKHNDFRPIFFMGCFYKIMSKVLANWLRSVMRSVISDTHSSFIKGKQILDSILIANEVVDEARKLNKEFLLLKVYFEKAYDSRDCPYLEVVMVKMNFLVLRIKWNMECVYCNDFSACK